MISCLSLSTIQCRSPDPEFPYYCSVHPISIPISQIEIQKRPKRKIEFMYDIDQVLPPTLTLKSLIDFPEIAHCKLVC